MPTLDNVDTIVGMLDDRCRYADELSESLDARVGTLLDVGGSLRFHRDHNMLSVATMDMAYIALENVDTKFADVTLLSDASYHSLEADAEATLLGIAEMVKTAWRDVKETVKKSIEVHKEYIHNVLMGGKYLRREIKQFDKRITKYSGSIVRSVKHGAYVQRLHVDGEFDAEHVIGGLNQLTEVAESLLTGYLKKSDKLYNDIVKGIRDAGSGANVAKESLAKISSTIKDTNAHLASVQENYGEELPGGMMLMYNRKTGKTDRISRAAGYTLSAIKLEPKKTKMSFTDGIEAGTRAQLRTILQRAGKLLDIFEGEADLMKSVMKSRDLAIKEGETLTRRSAVLNNEDINPDDITRLLGLANKNAMKSITLFTTYAWKVARAAIAYVESNLKHFDVAMAAEVEEREK